MSNAFLKRVEDFVGVREEKFYKTTLFHSDRLMLGLNCLQPGQVQKPHIHEAQDKFYYVVEGNGRFWVGNQRVEASAGEIVWAPAGVLHGVENGENGRLTLFMGISPAPE